MLSLLMLVAVPAVVRGHGGMVWPPIWQDARGVSVDNYVTGNVGSNPMVRDPATGRRINYVKSWLTDQAYTGGRGPEARGTGPATNPTCPAWARKLRYPWAAPGRAPNLGGGCGIHGGNPLGCPAGNDTRDPHSNPNCGQPGFSKGRGTWAFGSSALDIEFPQALTTEWKLGSRQKRNLGVWQQRAGHRVPSGTNNGVEAGEQTEGCLAVRRRPPGRLHLPAVQDASPGQERSDRGVFRPHRAALGQQDHPDPPSRQGRQAEVRLDHLQAEGCQCWHLS